MRGGFEIKAEKKDKRFDTNSLLLYDIPYYIWREIVKGKVGAKYIKVSLKNCTLVDYRLYL